MSCKTRISISALALSLTLLGCGDEAGDSTLDGADRDASAAFDTVAADTQARPGDTIAASDRGESGFDQAQDVARIDTLADAGGATDAFADAGVSLDAEDALDDSDTKPRADAGCTVLDNLPGSLPSISFAAYHSLPEMLTYLQALSLAAPDLAQYKVLGKSEQGRDVGIVTLNATCQPSPPAIFFNGAHHGDEDVSAEAVLSLPDYLLRKSTTDASVRVLLRTYAFTILPVVNPDGFVAGTRENANGNDINRDYASPGSSELLSFKTKEGQIIRDLQDAMGFVGAVAFHSGTQEVLWPWGYTGTGTPDEAFFLAAGKKTAEAMGFTIYQQSYDDYPTQGEYIDYAYAKSRTLVATFEISNSKSPSAAVLAGVVETARKGAVAWAQALIDHALGRLHALPAGPRPRFPFTAPFDGHNRLE